MCYYSQINEYTCAQACLLMILSHFKISSPLKNLWATANKKNGTSIYKLIKLANTFGLKGTAYKNEKKIFSDNIKTPFVALTYYKAKQNHYVVINKLKSNKIEIWDPYDCKKKYYDELISFYSKWSGIIITFKKK